MKLFINELVIVHSTCYYRKNYYRKFFDRFKISYKELYSAVGILKNNPDKLVNITAFIIDVQDVTLNQHNMEKFLQIFDDEELTPYDVRLKRVECKSYRLELKTHPKQFKIRNMKGEV